jgi:hypothetical protein
LHVDVNKAIYSPMNAHKNCLKNNIKICIKTAPISTSKQCHTHTHTHTHISRDLLTYAATSPPN